MSIMSFQDRSLQNGCRLLSPKSVLGIVLSIGVLLTDMVSSAHSPPKQPSGAELLRAIDRLSVVGNVLYVAAHPDDENTRLLAYLSSELQVRTAYLSLTRGDGGQNLIGPEQGPLLGLIRTQELLAARRVDSAEQFFTRARDFGYSKTPAETLSIWDRNAVLEDTVWVIRKFRPDVIITRFPTQGLDTHGHHTASAMLAEEAFAAAADPNFAKQQLAQVSVWQARRLLWNRSPWRSLAGEDLSKFLKLDVGSYNPVLGVSYGELASESRSMHKSQGFGSAKQRGASPEYFLPLLPKSESKLPASLFEGIDLSWNRVAGGGPLALLLAKISKSFDLRRPEASIPQLLQARRELLRLPDSPWKQPKLREIEDIIVACAGLYAEASASDHAITEGSDLSVSLQVINRSTAPLRLREIHLSTGEKLSVEQNLASGELWQKEQTIRIPAQTPIGNPYWLTQQPLPGLYPVRDPLRIGMPEDPPVAQAEFVIEWSGPQGEKETLTVDRAVLHKWTDPVAGERTRSIEVWPQVMVNVDGKVMMFADGEKKPLRVRLKAGQADVKGTVRIEVPSGFSVEPSAIPFQLDKKGAEEEVLFQVRPKANPQATPIVGTLRVIAETNGQSFDRGIVRIEHPHIPIQTVFPEASVSLCRFDLKKTRSRIGYIAGAGDDVAAALRQVGFDVTQLSEEQILQKPLAPYGAIVVGVRAFNVNPRLPFYYKKLMDYVQAGGNLVVQYSTSNRLGKLQVPIGPHPFEISTDRVTDENAPVTFALPNHPILQRPNKITAADFSGWVQERGLYFADKIDEKYETPLSLRDPGEPERRGSLLFVRHGKGSFVYTGLAFFRQLPAGVPGAFRLFANLISHEP